MKLQLREYVVFAAGVVIAGACIFRLQSPLQTGAQDVRISDRRPAPAFELYDQNSRAVNLSAYLNRHKILLVFFDGQTDPDSDPVLQQLSQFHAALAKTNVTVIAVSNALPQTIRGKGNRPLPFAVLSDVTAGQPGSASVLWNVADPAAPRQPAAASAPTSAVIRPSVFFIDAGGLVDWDGKHPRSLSDPQPFISRLVAEG